MLLCERLPPGGSCHREVTEGEAEYKGESVSMEGTENSMLPQAPSVTLTRATFLSEEGFQENPFTGSK